MTHPDKALKVMVVGSGGREHTLVRLCRRSPYCESVIAAPGNGGMAGEVDCFPVKAEDIDGLVHLAVSRKIDFVAIGPEAPLSLGLADALALKGIPAFGPNREAAQLEASKTFTKDLLQRHGIPTARAERFDAPEPAVAWLRDQKFPVVIKADGLAAGKGVVIADDFAAAEKTVREMMEKKVFGESGSRVLIEEMLTGEEASIHLLVSGRDFAVLPTSQDHKRIGENDTGLNTGGMGAYSPAGLVSGAVYDEVVRQIVAPSVRAIADDGIEFRGLLYIGIMLTSDGPKVIEYNVRFGDPETQVILPRLETDVLHLMHACAHGYLGEVPVKVRDEHALCVVLAAKGYPGDYPRGEPIRLPDEVPAHCEIYHAGTALSGEPKQLVTNGGRVLGVTAMAPSLEKAASEAYALCEKIDFAGKYYRRDIGAKQLIR